MQTVQQLFLDPLQAAWVEVASKIGSVLPKVAAAVIILILGWIISKVLARISKRILFLARIDRLATKAGIEQFLLKGGVRKNTVQILEGVVYWFFLTLTFITAFSAVGLSEVVTPLTSLLLYIPNIFIVIMILVAGAYIAAFADSTVRTYSTNIGVKKPELAGRISRGLVLLFVIIIALDQLRLEVNILGQAFLVIMASLGLGIAIAIGLGAKDLAKAHLERIISPPK